PFEGLAAALGRADFAAVEDFLMGVALRTGAFSAAERFGSAPAGRAGFVVTLRLLAEALDVALGDAAGREAGLLAPFMTGSLMRSTRFSQIAQTTSEAQ
ncbi:MAG TPA: hypothetical protein VF754_08980, partial [Pyrinomonadaceae bacterium]